VDKGLRQEDSEISEETKGVSILVLVDKGLRLKRTLKAHEGTGKSFNPCFSG